MDALTFQNDRSLSRCIGVINGRVNRPLGYVYASMQPTLDASPIRVGRLRNWPVMRDSRAHAAAADAVAVTSISAH